MDQGSLHKTRYTEYNGRENREEPKTHRHMGNFPEQNTNGLCSKITKRQMGPHKTAVNKTKHHPTDLEKIFTNHSTHREIISNIYKECKKLDSRETYNPIKNEVQCLN